MQRHITSKTGLFPRGSQKYFYKLKGVHCGRQAFVIGNGPSLRVEDLDRLENEITFAANKIYLSFDETKWRPSYYLVEDDLVYKQNYEKIKSLDCCPKYFPNSAKGWGEIIDSASYFHLDYTPINTADDAIGKCPIKGFRWGSSVVYSALQFAIYMGCNPIYLIGVDFSFLMPQKGADGIQLTYEGEKNHFHKDYRKEGEKWNVPNLEYQHHALSQLAIQVRDLGIEVYNATRGGKLEVFPRRDLDELFETK
jgi:hypothetical protein